MELRILLSTPSAKFTKKKHFYSMNRLLFRVFDFFCFWYATNVQCLSCSAYFEAAEARRKRRSERERGTSREEINGILIVIVISKSKSGWNYVFVSEHRFERAKINNTNGDTVRYRVSVAMDICRFGPRDFVFSFLLYASLTGLTFSMLCIPNIFFRWFS